MRPLSLATPIPLWYQGPPLEQGPLPALLYFALSAEETLTLAPFNTPITLLQEAPLRIFSATLPYHGIGYPAKEAMHHWALALRQDSSFLCDFLDQLEQSLQILFASPYVLSHKSAVAGLSRGALIAAHMSARLQALSSLLLFAPLCDLKTCPEFAHTSPEMLQTLSLYSLCPKLSTKTIRAYIGGRDTRVSTKTCYEWICSTIDCAYEKKIRPIPIELRITPSIGYLGHGTSPETFQEGSLWIYQQLHS